MNALVDPDLLKYGYKASLGGDKHEYWRKGKAVDCTFH
jgi:hypothetical protein